MCRSPHRQGCGDEQGGNMTIIALASVVLATTVAPPTAIGDAVVACEEAQYADVDGSGTNGFFLLDDGHSISIQDAASLDVAPQRVVSARFQCVAEELRLPEWLAVRMALPSADNTITVGQYTITWALGDGGVSQFLIYDEVAAAGQTG
jgi:hypothetical protein